MPWFLTFVFWYAPPRVICPSCQFVADIFACDVGQINGMFPRVFCPHEGRFAIVTKRWARDAVDVYLRKTSAVLSGRRSRGVLISRRWYQVSGRIRWRWWQESPITRETTKEAVKTIARGMPGVPA